MRIDVKPAQGTIRKLKAELSKQQIDGAMARALNHTIRKSRTVGSKAIRETYTMKAGEIRKRTKVVKARRTHLEAKLTAPVRPLPLLAFRARQVKKGVSVMVRKGQRKIVRSAFIQTAQGRRGVFARGKYASSGFKFRKQRVRPTGPDLPIDELRTLSLVGAYGADEVRDSMGAQVISDLDGRFEHELTRALERARARSSTTG